MPNPVVIDISHWNIIPNDLKATAAAGIIGVIHKATEGAGNQDDKVDAREHLAKQAGLLFGLYHFIRPGQIGPQVNNFMNVFKRYDSTNLLVALDYEDPKVSLDDCLAWSEMVASRTGKKVVMYSGHVLKEKLAFKRHAQLNQDNFPLWLAQYGPRATLPPGWTSYWLWQYTDKGRIPGVTGDVDLNDGDAKAVRAFWQGSEAPPEPVEPPVPPVGTKDYSDAMRLVLDGFKVTRKAWAGQYMWVVYTRPTGTLTRSFLSIVTSIGEVVPYNPSQLDMTANDWLQVE